MEMDLNFWLQLLTVAFCIGLGGRYGGVGLGAAGGLGVCILVLLFGLKPSSPPVSTILIIVAVIACTSILQGAGGLDWMVKIAERMLRKWPKAITFVAPFVCSLFVIFVGTAYVAFAVYPVVAEVATQARVRPERPIAASVISAGIAVVASPMSAATAALVAALSPYNVSCLAVYWKGTELENDPEFRRRVESGDFQDLVMTEKKSEKEDASKMKKVRLSVGIFGLGVATVLILGFFKELLPVWTVAGKTSTLPIPQLIQMVMLACGLFIIVACRIPSHKFADGSVFRAGLIGVVGVFGIAWCTGTFFDLHTKLLADVFSSLAKDAPFVFCVAAFCASSVIFSPTVSTTIMMPLGLKFGLPPEFLIGTWACCFGDFLIPGGAQIGCTAFDRTGTTKLGSFVINHSYLRPGLVFVVSGTIIGWCISKIVF